VIGAVVHASVASPEPGQVIHKAGNGLILGEPAGGASERLDTVARAFSESGFDVRPDDRLRLIIFAHLRCVIIR
jgi:2-dehydropantoate 2-reductase